jgi:pyruvate/2-oxoglutarate dehydrogenase complex dihydrolipoamide acyltransferase (E2) component
MVDVTIPEGLWPEENTGVLTTWLYEDGDAVSAGDLIAEVMSEKVQFEIEAPASGRLTIKTAAEEEVTTGMVIATLD